MTWRKKLDSRAYDPVSAFTIGPNVGSLSSIVVHEATYTVVNDYFCMFNVRVNFSQDVAVSNIIYIDAPLPMIGPAYAPIGAGRVFTNYLGTFNYPVSVERNNTAQSWIITADGNFFGGNTDLKIFGHYPVR